MRWGAVDTDNGAPVTSYTVEYTDKEDFEVNEPSVHREQGLDWTRAQTGYTFTTEELADWDTSTPYEANMTNLTCGSAVVVRRAHNRQGAGGPG